MVRSYEKEDIQTIITLGREINHNFAKLFSVENLPENEIIFVYEKNRQVIGFIHLLINLDYLEILNLIVAQEYRKQGIASVLLDYLLSDTALDVSRILLEVRESNVPAINLYKKFNFFVIHARKNYYGNENGIVMERRG